MQQRQDRPAAGSADYTVCQRRSKRMSPSLFERAYCAIAVIRLFHANGASVMHRSCIVVRHARCSRHLNVPASRPEPLSPPLQLACSVKLWKRTRNWTALAQAALAAHPRKHATECCPLPLPRRSESQKKRSPFHMLTAQNTAQKRVPKFNQIAPQAHPSCRAT